jgi:hypothetical protein
MPVFLLEQKGSGVHCGSEYELGARGKQLLQRQSSD